MAPTIAAVTEQNFRKEVLDESRTRPVLVDFWATWCGPCRTLAPVLESIARQMQERLRVVKLDTDANQRLAAEFGIRSIPTIMLFKDGRPVGQLIGAHPQSAIDTWLQPFLGSAQPSGLRQEAASARQQGDTARARELLHQALEEQPDDHESLLDLAEIDVQDGEVDTALDMLKSLPLEQRESSRAKALIARSFFIQEGKRPAADFAGADAGTGHMLYRDGVGAVLRGDMPGGGERFLELMAKDRAYGDDAARKALLRLFDLLGDDDPLVADYRRRMGRLLH